MRNEAPKGDTCLFTGLVQTGNGENIPFYLPGVKEEHVKGAINYLHTQVMGGDHKSKSEFVGVAGDISFDEGAGWAKSVEEAEKIANRFLTNKVINAGDGKVFVINLPDGRKIYKKSVATRIRKATAQEMLWQKSKKSDKRAESATPVKQQEADMSGNITKTELEALLRANKSEVDVVAAEMKKDIAEFKSFQAQQFATLNSTLSDIKGQVTSTNAELTAVKGQIDGMKTSYASIQWMVGAILMVLALILALPQIQSYLKSSEQPEQVVQTVPPQPYSAPQPEPQKAPATKQ